MKLYLHLFPSYSFFLSDSSSVLNPCHAFLLYSSLYLQFFCLYRLLPIKTEMCFPGSHSMSCFDAQTFPSYHPISQLLVAIQLFKTVYTFFPVTLGPFHSSIVRLLTQLPLCNCYCWDSEGIHVVTYNWSLSIIILYELLAVFNT